MCAIAAVAFAFSNVGDAIEIEIICTRRRRQLYRYMLRQGRRLILIAMHTHTLIHIFTIFH